MTNPKRAWVPAPPPKGSPPPVGPYTPVIRAGNLVFISGQTPRDPVTGEVGPAELQVQARRTLHNLKNVLLAAEGSLEDIVSVTVYLANEEHWGEFNEVYKEFFTEPYPTRTAVGCQLRGILVEVSAIAMLGTTGGWKPAGAPTPSGPAGGSGKGFRPDMTLY